jgi:hypothetical protein
MNKYWQMMSNSAGTVAIQGSALLLPSDKVEEGRRSVQDTRDPTTRDRDGAI